MNEAPTGPVQDAAGTAARPPTRLGVICFGLAVGSTAAIYVFLLGITAGLFGWGWVAVEVLASMFIGYSPTIVGSITGAVWAFVDGFVAGALIAQFYNLFTRSRR